MSDHIDKLIGEIVGDNWDTEDADLSDVLIVNGVLDHIRSRLVERLKSFGGVIINPHKQVLWDTANALSLENCKLKFLYDTIAGDHFVDWDHAELNGYRCVPLFTIEAGGGE